jgi:hypothetical protein
MMPDVGMTQEDSTGTNPPRQFLRRWWIVAAGVVLLVGGVALVLATRHDAGPKVDDDATSAAPSGTQRTFRPGTAGADSAVAGWERKVPGGDCQCADGSEFSFYARPADQTKVVLFLDGGGACWSAQTCARDGNNKYQTKAEAPNGEGVMDLTDKRNPLAGASFVFVPYCTADVHLGNVTTEYSAGLTIRHKGSVNGTAALDYLAATFPNATQVIVIGSSAGSVAAPAYAGWVADRLTNAHVTAVSDSSGSYPDRPAVNSLLAKAWNVADGDTWSMPGLFIQAGRRHPDIVFARFDHENDHDQKFHLTLIGVPTDDLPGLIRANEAQIERAGVKLHSYTSAGEDHVDFDDGRFYTETVNGVPLVDWFTKLLQRQPVQDVPA